MQANPEPPKKNNDKSKKISRKPLAAKNKWRKEGVVSIPLEWLDSLYGPFFPLFYDTDIIYCIFDFGCVVDLIYLSN